MHQHQCLLAFALTVLLYPGGRVVADDMISPTLRVTPSPMRHDHVVLCVVFSPDGKLLASGSYDNTIKLWDIGSGKELATLKGHTEQVTSLAFSPDGKTLASGSYENHVSKYSARSEGMVKLWEIPSGKELATMKGPGDEAVRSVAFSPDGAILVAACSKTLMMWDAATRKQSAVLKADTFLLFSVAFSPDGKTLAAGCWNGSIKRWEVATGKELPPLKGHTNFVLSIVFSPDGKTLLSGSNDGTVKLWDTDTGNVRTTLKGHTGGVNTVAFGQNGKIIASGGAAKTTDLNAIPGELKLWDAVTGKEIVTLDGYPRSVNSVAFSPDDKILATGSDIRKILLWDLYSKKK